MATLPGLREFLLCGISALRKNSSGLHGRIELHDLELLTFSCSSNGTAMSIQNSDIKIANPESELREKFARRGRCKMLP